ncbi:hypothetical protein M427DRAFT_121108 [Gonapodya prolifera JEL478]|uniref:Phospholipase/carboxylesterase/thioesterase domain-containing protein n=1 Tax=Gonapodya prolifera (strain JEL478) TaxID=1344416 RepID=A0A139APV4_GONPJ|nr:hypothetical protein M427DRAFT_121108 [Gonapodya prolifera JEL478]|eukprot:KXS18684.1 hypothetical protein M427DRAFT_121108 [Gonapodya prolifera JEL478]
MSTPKPNSSRTFEAGPTKLQAERVDGAGSRGESLRRKPPSRSNPWFEFEYRPSPDGVDENLLVFFHGLGDSPRPFMDLGRKMNLPQTAIMSLKAPFLVPFTYDDGSRAWFPSISEQDAELLPPNHPRRFWGLLYTRYALARFFSDYVFPQAPSSSSKHYASGWPAERVTLFGFSQGGSIAIDLALLGKFREERTRFSGVISIAGHLLPEHLRLAEKGRLIDEWGPMTRGTRILITAGSKDDVTTLKDAKKAFDVTREIALGTQDESEEVEGDLCRLLVVDGKGHGMAEGKAEWAAIMQTLSKTTVRRNTALENMTDLYEVKRTE